MKYLALAMVLPLFVLFAPAPAVAGDLPKVNRYQSMKKRPSQHQRQSQRQRQTQRQTQRASASADSQGTINQTFTEESEDIPVAGAYAPPSICGPSFGVQFKDVGASMGTGMDAFCKLAEVVRVSLLIGDEATAKAAHLRMSEMAFVQAGQGRKWVDKVPIVRTVLGWAW